jgi:hypothetical protein
MSVVNKFDEVFAIEIEGWAYGIQNYPGEVFPGLVHAVIREIKPTFRSAIEHGVPFDIMAISRKLSKAAKFLVTEKEIAFSILAQLPNPIDLDEDGQYIMAQVIDPVEQEYGGALSRLQKKWAYEKQKREAA